MFTSVREFVDLFASRITEKLLNGFPWKSLCDMSKEIIFCGDPDIFLSLSFTLCDFFFWDVFTIHTRNTARNLMKNIPHIYGTDFLFVILICEMVTERDIQDRKDTRHIYITKRHTDVT